MGEGWGRGGGRVWETGATGATGWRVGKGEGGGGRGMGKGGVWETGVTRSRVDV